MAIKNELEWCDANMTTDYPLVSVSASSTVGMSESGVRLPNSFLADIQLVIPSSAAVSRQGSFYVSRIDRTDSGFIIKISCYISNDTFVLCGTTGVIPLDIRNTVDVSRRTFSISSVSVPSEYRELSGMTGNVVIGSCVDMQNIGVLTFRYVNAALIGLRVFCYDTGLDHVTFVDADGNATTLYDNFTMQAGSGVNFEIGTDFEGRPAVYVVRVPTAEELANPYQDIGSIVNAIMARLGTPIRRINGVAPDAGGNFGVDGGDCVSVNAHGNSITISNPCSKPCCDDSTTSADVASSLELLESAQQRLQGYYEAINNNINMIQSRLASLIASRG